MIMVSYRYHYHLTQNK